MASKGFSFPVTTLAGTSFRNFLAVFPNVLLTQSSWLKPIANYLSDIINKFGYEKLEVRKPL